MAGASKHAFWGDSRTSGNTGGGRLPQKLRLLAAVRQPHQRIHMSAPTGLGADGIAAISGSYIHIAIVLGADKMPQVP